MNEHRKASRIYSDLQGLPPMKNNIEIRDDDPVVAKAVNKGVGL